MKGRMSMPENENGEIRIGVYTCYCGGNISDVVNCDKVAEQLQKYPNVVVSRTNMAMCSDMGQSMIQEDIQEKGVNRVVIGACAPSLHEQTFRNAITRAGLNPYLYYHVGLREQDSWVHKGDCEGATHKAVRLMATGLAKARLLDPLSPIELSAEKHSLVIGGGIAGLKSALDIAKRGLKVTLIEKSPFLGGRVAQLDTLFPTDENARDALNEIIQAVSSQPNISIFTQTQVADITGYVGDYQVLLKQDSRGVTESDGEAIMAACQQTVPDPFNYGLTERKVVYQAYPGCFPPTPVVDWENYDGSEINVGGEKIILKNKPTEIPLHVGAIVVATGFNPYEPGEGEYGYGQIAEVVTLPALIRHLTMLEKSEELVWNGHPVRDIALVHCVGSREIDGIHEPQSDGNVNNYCSRVCCTASLHMINNLKERFPELNIYDLYEDIRTYGRGHEAYFRGSLENMVRFLRFHGDDRPDVKKAPPGDTHPVLVEIRDHLTNGKELELPVDLVVLAVGIMPREIDQLIKKLKIVRGSDRFLAETHPKLQPVETAVPGVILAGTAQGPMTVQESCAAASAAAAKVSALLSQGQVELQPFVAQVDPNKCTGTGACVSVCSYDGAIALEDIDLNGKTVQRAVVTPANCTGCGCCVSACPNQAIEVQGWTIPQYDAMLDAIAFDISELQEVAE
jgi:heterodisulfide reductase subunit A